MTLTNAAVMVALATKEALKEFMAFGKMDEMSDNDFEAIFAALDADKSLCGEVDFLEFCYL